MLEELGISVGYHARSEFLRRDLKRLHGAEYKSSEKNKKQRQVKRKERLDKEDQDNQKEGVLYDAGGF